MEDEVCWICLEGSFHDKELTRACRCPHTVHAACLARWQLQQAGTRRERYCQFCAAELPCWRDVLTPASLDLQSAQATMNVEASGGGEPHYFHVRGGEDGYECFVAAIRRVFAVRDDADLTISYACDCPLTGTASAIVLSGAAAFDAAVHCAKISAARRRENILADPLKHRSLSWRAQHVHDATQHTEQHTVPEQVLMRPVPHLSRHRAFSVLTHKLQGVLRALICRPSRGLLLLRRHSV